MSVLADPGEFFYLVEWLMPYSSTAGPVVRSEQISTSTTLSGFADNCTYIIRAKLGLVVAGMSYHDVIDGQVSCTTRLQISSLTGVALAPGAVELFWPPATANTSVSYSVRSRARGDEQWGPEMMTTQAVATLRDLQPDTLYDFEVRLRMGDLQSEPACCTVLSR